MGEQILKLFRTGNNMATRRPTTVILESSEPEDDSCKLYVEFEGERAEFGDRKFELICDKIYNETLQR